MTPQQCLTDGGLPDGYTRANLVWLAQAHHALAHPNHAQNNAARAAWHRRWVHLLADLLETDNGRY